MVLYLYGNFQAFKENQSLWVVLVHSIRSNDSRCNNAWFMHKLYIFLCIPQTDWWRIQPKSHWKVIKFCWKIQIRLDSLILKLQSDKMKCTFFPLMQIFLVPSAISHSQRINLCTQTMHNLHVIVLVVSEGAISKFSMKRISQKLC